MTKNENENEIDELIHDYIKQFPKTGFQWNYYVLMERKKLLKY